MNQESNSRILVAAAAGISVENWIKSVLDGVLVSRGVSIRMFGKNETLRRVLDSSGRDFSSVFTDGKCSKSELRKLIAETDFLLLLWDGVEHTKLLFEARLQSKKIKLAVFEVTTVVNRDKGDDFDIYIGRGTPWGNPYPVGPKEGQHTREEAIDFYRRDFEAKLKNEADFKRGILGLRGYRLGCFCKPFACHGDVIAEYLNSHTPEVPSEV